MTAASTTAGGPDDMTSARSLVFLAIEAVGALPREGMPQQHRHVMIVLANCQRGNGIFPSLKQIADWTGMPVSNLKVALNELEAGGWISRSRRCSPDGDPTSTWYELHLTGSPIGKPVTRRERRPATGQPRPAMGQPDAFEVGQLLANRWPVAGQPLASNGLTVGQQLATKHQEKHQEKHRQETPTPASGAVATPDGAAGGLTDLDAAPVTQSSPAMAQESSEANKGSETPQLDATDPWGLYAPPAAPSAPVNQPREQPAQPGEIPVPRSAPPVETALPLRQEPSGGPIATPDGLPVVQAQTPMLLGTPEPAEPRATRAPRRASRKAAPRSGKQPKEPTAADRYAVAYAQGQTDASGQPFRPPTAKGSFWPILQAHACGADGAPITGDALLAWIRTNSAEYRRAKGGEAEYQCGFSPTSWGKWLDAGKPGPRGRERLNLKQAAAPGARMAVVELTPEEYEQECLF